MNISIIFHKLSSLKVRVQALISRADISIPYDEELRSVFERYNSLLNELQTLNANYFCDLVPREPKVDGDSGWVSCESVEILKLDIAEIERALELLELSEEEEQRATEIRFWSQRTNPAGAKDWLKHSAPALGAVIDRLKCSAYFAEQLGIPCSYCERPHTLSEPRVNQLLSEQLPGVKYPMEKATIDQLFDLIEFLYRYVSKATEWIRCYDDDRCPSGFSARAGRQEYTKEINAVLTRFGAPYRLTQGQIVRVGSKIIEEVLEEPITTDDQELNGLIRRAVEAFKDRKDRRVEAAEVCCKAFEHLKHKYGKDTKVSSETLIRNVVENTEQFNKLNAFWTALTNLGHGTVRHSKPDSPSTSDPILAEYLFLQYYTSIQFASKRLARNQSLDDIFGVSIETTELAAYKA